MEVAVGSFFHTLSEGISDHVLQAVSNRSKSLPGRPNKASYKTDNADLDGSDLDLPSLSQIDPFLKFDELGNIIRQYEIDIIELTWPHWNLQLGITADFSLTDPTVTRILADSGTRIVGINDVTRESVRDLLRYGNENGWSIGDLVRGTADHPGLRATVEQTYRNRARTIARTELGNAQNQAGAERYEAAGIKEVYVMDNGDSDDDDECKKVNNTVQTLEWSKKNLLQHPNCTRAFAPEVKSRTTPKPERTKPTPPSPAPPPPPPPPARGDPDEVDRDNMTAEEIRQAMLAEMSDPAFYGRVDKLDRLIGERQKYYNSNRGLLGEGAKEFYSKTTKMMMDREELLDQIHKRIREKYLHVKDPAKLDMYMSGADYPEATTTRTRKAFAEALEELQKMVSRLVLNDDEATGGKAVWVHKTTRDRAFADHQSNRIHLSGGDVGTFIHEYAHCIEGSKLANFIEARRWIDSRTVGERPTHLGRGYAKNEVAKKDEFMHPYIGKSYNTATEAISMGITYMYQDPRNLAKRDPDYFNFLIDFMRGKHIKKK